MDWNEVRYFLAVARKGSLSGAAKELGVNHSTVFRRIQNFEESFGVRLFDRLPTGYALTLAGEEMFQQALLIEKEMHNLELNLMGKDFQLKGDILLTLPANISYRYLPAYLKHFHKQYPEIRVEVEVGNSSLDLSRREADVAIRSAQKLPESLVGRKLIAFSWHLYGHPNYFKQYGKPKSWSDLKDHLFISANAELSPLPAFQWFKKQISESQVIMSTNNLNTMFHFAAEGNALTILPRDQYKPELETILPLPPECASQLWLLTHQELRDVARIKVFMKFLADCFSEQAID